MYETPEGVVSVQAKTVVMTIPSYVASDILRPLSVSYIYLINFLFPKYTAALHCFLRSSIHFSVDRK